MRKKIFTFLLALAASVGMMNAKVTWKRCNISDLNIYGTDGSYSKEGVTLSTHGDEIYARWYAYGDESKSGIGFNTNQTGGFTFSNTLGKNFTKIEMTLRGPGGWDMVNLGSGWNIDGDPWDVMKAIWTGNASTVDLAKDASDLHGDYVKRIVFYFEGDSEEPDPTYTVALKDGTANADKVTLSATSVEECTTVTVTPNEECDITAFKATYNTTEELSTSFNTETGAYSFTMPAANVTIEATIALKPVPEGDIFAGFTATAGSGGFDNEGHANLVDNKFTSADWTKWCADNSYKSVPTGETGDACWWIDFEASAALNLTGYILTTGNDTGNEHGRNPKNWLLKAKLNADDAWTTIATVTNDVTMKNQSFKDYKFFVDQQGTYQYFRFEVFANQGAGVMQLCELRLIGTEPVLVTTHTLQLHVNDALMGSVALQNPSNDIVDNGDGTYTVPEGATVTLIATPNEGYEFTGWKASSTICDFNECEFVALPTVDNPLTVDMYQEAAFMAEFAAVAPADNSVKLYHNFSGDWMETEAFGIFDDYTSEYAKISMILEPGDYQFAVKVGGELRGDGTALSRNKQACILGEGLTANLTLNVDVKGTYRFYWFYDENRFAMDVPNVCGMYWQNITDDEFEVTLGKESEVTLPTVYTTNMGFASNIFNGVDQVRLVSTDETVATIEYTLSLDGLGTITIHKAGECDIYAVHDITDYYCYDSVAFHLTVLPTPQPANPSGSCGENLTWEFDPSTGALTISGTGAMTSHPWVAYAEDITSLSLPDGLTAIPSEAFKGCTGLTTVTIPASVTSIGADAFLGCTSVTDVYCYPKAADLDWNDYYTDDFIEYPAIETRCHVYADECSEYIARYSQGDGVNVTFMNDLEAVAVTTNEDPKNPAIYYSTFYHGTQKYRLPDDGTEAYVADLSGSDLRLTKIAEGNKVLPNGVAVILKAPSNNITLTPSDAAAVAVTATNDLLGVDAETAAPENCYVLSGTDQYGVGFYRINSENLKAHKAYVIYTGSAAPKRMRFVFNQTTDVESIQPSAVSIQKILENGQVIIIRNGVRYNAAGQIVK